MSAGVGILDFLLWCVQEGGVLLSVGAALAVLAGYVYALRDGKVTEKEARYSKNSHRVLDIGLVLMVASGLAIVALHFSLAQEAVVYAPVFLFKWILIAGLAAAYLSQRKKPYGHYLLEGAVGGTWLTLFLVHTVAPAVSWTYLFILYALVMTGFLLFWSAVVKMTKEKNIAPLKPLQLQAAPALSQAIPAKPVQSTAIPAPALPKPPVPKPIVVPVAAVSAPAAAAPMVAPVAQAAIPAPPQKPFEPHHSLWLPAIHVMPKDQKQLDDKTHITPLAAVTKTP